MTLAGECCQVLASPPPPHIPPRNHQALDLVGAFVDRAPGAAYPPCAAHGAGLETVLSLVREKCGSMATGAESRAEVYLMALRSLSRAEREAVIARLLEDPQLREDILDLAFIRERQGERARPLAAYLAERRLNCLGGAR